MAENTSPAITMTCEVCSEYYTDPLMLPCLHSFCKKCLIKAKEKESSADTSLKCPTCDTSVNLPGSSINQKKLSLKINLLQSVASCDEVIPPITEAIANGEKMLEQIATRKEEVTKEIQETFEELKALLGKRCNDLLMETEEIANAKRSSVMKQLDGFRKLVKQVSCGCHLVSSVSERTDPGEILSVKKLITNQLENCIEDDGSKEEGRVVIVNDNNTAIVSCTPQDCRLGNGLARETTQSIGQYELSVTIKGQHIKGSPYQLSVKASRDYRIAGFIDE
ncbi:PREDICTED: E3 ubiquitin-protein ligase rnf168-like [Amphimedon queenslandica]|uniref:RING-type domain-containing protein n=1 Tax=Amphimedon queenslandica TaxID=400682 RepID=A0AAN0IK25_AMPQE|nr:PREDICTED: E3 ubiquitin-protein ligase rnf168-like [Amphimedon queenslandica]|eukprot:XP_011402756.1 PREDICTED: E3 ubiquitin-protein ligase rnf168-like [Amphimedon queenslandica]